MKWESTKVHDLTPKVAIISMFNSIHDLVQGILTVVDVYSEWAGPCNAMANYLKKIKLEVGDELLQCAMANCDTIDALKMFRGHCKPIWLFIISGESSTAQVTL